MTASWLLRCTSCLITVAPMAAFALQPLITDDTGTQGAGGNQIEATYNQYRDRTTAATDTTRELVATYTLGVIDSLDIYLGASHLDVIPGAAGATERGSSNPVLGAKWRFQQSDESKLSFALNPEVRRRVSSDREAQGLGTGRTSYGLGLLMTQETGFGEILANATIDRYNHSDPALNAAERRTRYRLSVAPVWEVTEHWKLAIDTGAITNPDIAEKQWMGYLQFAAIHAPSKNLELAAGLLRGGHDGSLRTTVMTLGVTWRFL